ncbi:uncharacterized protein LOC122504634 [Leptopilina heterotoma]|uniref:uncharacterized protein LOC122504634 n=1 Tax=Leptopilina heterotoma TaxID=63436 RepID=UPI001CA8C899|nr:uncharacterized protein LOC122504634 [Leptopilina heterotoma]
MSNSLVQKSLDILDSEKVVKQGKIRKADKGVLDLIPVNHRLTSKRSKSRKDILKKPKRVTVYQAKKQLEVKSDPIAENIKTLLYFSRTSFDSNTEEKLLERVVKNQSTSKEKIEKPETSVFTEEDHKNFQLEYLNEE